MYITVDEEIKLNDYITDGYKVWKWKDDSSLLGRKKVILSDDPTLLDSGVQAIPNDLPRGESVNVYITVDEEIKIGDREIIDNECRKLKFTKNETRIGKKVILTDNPTLIDDGVQEIPDDFLEWLVKNPSCEFVEVEKVKDPTDRSWYNTVLCRRIYKIILPKEEPKQEFTTVNGSSGCTITITDEIGKPIPYCGGLEEPKPHSFCETPEEKCTMNYCNENGCQNRKRQLTDLEIAIRLEEIEREEPKQETIEEAAENHWKMQYLFRPGISILVCF
jgi:hypothetical protein